MNPLTKIKLPKDLILEKMDDAVHDEITDHTRWSVLHWMVFEHEGKYYGVGYSVGATESQDESPFEYEGPEIEVSEVEQVTKTVTTWEYKKVTAKL